MGTIGELRGGKLNNGWLKVGSLGDHKAHEKDFNS